MREKAIGILLTVVLLFGIIPTAAAGSSNADSTVNTNTESGKGLKNKLPEGFPSFIPLVDDASLVNYFKKSYDGHFYMIFTTGQSAQKLWDFYSNVNLYNNFDRCIASFDNKTGKISIEASQRGMNGMDICFGQDAYKQMHIIITIKAAAGYETFLGIIGDTVMDFEKEMDFFDAFFALNTSGVSGLNISSGRTSANRDAFRGKIAAGFPAHIPLVKNINNVVVESTSQLDDVKYTKYKYNTKIPESECMEFYKNYHNYSNLESFQFDYENHKGTKNMKVYARSKAGILGGIHYFYNGARGTVVISHNSEENSMFMSLN